MVTLVPAPDTLDFASPALGPWFAHPSDDPLPLLGIPSADLSVGVQLSANMDWLAPAICTRAYIVASPTRPPVLRALRQADGTPAFAKNALVVLLTLLPEAELRLWALTQAIPAPDGSAVAGTGQPVGTPARPRIRWLALEVPAAQLSDVEALLPANTIPASLTTDPDKASWLGLSLSGGLANADMPARALLRPTEAALANGTGEPLAAKLWCFDFRGRPVDPGAVANWWAFMASADIWDNLWEDGNPPAILDAAGTTLALPTTRVTTGRVVQIVNAHEGPVDPTLLARLTLTGLTAVPSSTDLFIAGAAPAIGLSVAPNPDDAPIPRIATLPLGAYAAPGTATPFAGWTGEAFPATIGRDFTRIAAVDVERQTTGLTRADHPSQADARRRITPAQNSAATPVLRHAELVTAQAMTVLAGGAAAEVMAPVMDPLWGAVTPPSLGPTPAPTPATPSPVPAALAPAPMALAGEGTTSAGNSVADQVIAIHFAPGELPPNVWIRIWTHGLDTQTGKRFRQDGGAGFSDGSGEAWVVLPISDGVGAPTAPGADPVLLSFDAQITTATASFYYADQRYARPATVAGARVDVQSPPGGTTFWIAEQGAAFLPGGGQYQSGQHLLALGGAAPALADLTTLQPADMAGNTLPNAVRAGDRIVLTEPAFAQTPDGTLAAAPNVANLKKHVRAAPAGLVTMGRPAPSQERRELVAHDRAGAQGVIGAVPARETNHTNPPQQTGHVGVPAGAEIRGPGIALAGPAADLLAPLMDERAADTLADFLSRAGTPLTPSTAPASPSTWAAILETTTNGVAGEGIVRSFLATIGADYQPGQTWLQIKTQIGNIAEQDIDALIDTSTLDDNALATAVDRMILKTRDGARNLASALLDAVGRAEDFIYLETPAIDPLAAEGGAIDLVGAINTRLAARPGLRVMLCVPERFLPNQTAKLEEIRKAAIAGALHSLQTAGSDRVALFSPNAGPGRFAHLAATTVIVDDAILMTGTAHLWRRGLTFDSALSVGLFDETVVNGRPAAVRAARIQFMADALGLPANFLPEDPDDCLAAIRTLNRTGGGGRVRPGAYPPAADTTPPAEQTIWNPDGRPGFTPDWALILADLSGGANTDFNNAIR